MPRQRWPSCAVPQQREPLHAPQPQPLHASFGAAPAPPPLSSVAARASGMLAALAQMLTPAAHTAASVPQIDAGKMLLRVASDMLGPVSADAPLMEAGLDSLASVEFRNRVQSELGESIALPETLVFDFPTIRSLVKHIDAEIASSAAPAQAHCPPLWLATTFACVAYGLVMRREAGVAGGSRRNTHII